MVEPKLLKSVESNNIFPFSYTSSSPLGTIMSTKAAKTLQGYMRNVVKSGTGTSAASKARRCTEKREPRDIRKTAR